MIGYAVDPERLAIERTALADDTLHIARILGEKSLPGGDQALIVFYRARDGRLTGQANNLRGDIE